MTWPPNVETVTVTGVFLHPDGSPYQGTVAFTAGEAVESVEHDAIVQGTLVIPLAVDGSLSVTLLATDADGFTPSGWLYRVDEARVGGPARAYYLALPAAIPEVALPGT
ncbi:hypothetical protein ACIRQH_35160 [Streptomyces sp. NPDC102279]|uniref:hypothetical protein n=1 Tax=Streptomyces sp. NPDC102279 TaxID=3366153 RepID=UPI003801EF2B